MKFLYRLRRLNKQQKFLQAQRATSSLAISFEPPALAVQSCEEGEHNGLFKKSSVKGLTTPVTLEAATVKDPTRV